MDTPHLTIGSRGSQLALWQARWVAARLADLGVATTIEIIKTTGDKITDVPLAKVGGKGLFTKEIEEALLDGRIDLAVHSLKDLPTELPPGLAVAAYPEREDPRDALVGCRLEDLAPGARVGTSSLRRAAQLRALRPDLHIESVRGNLDTRLRKRDEGRYDAIVLAAAGLRRLGWGARIAEAFAPEVMCPAVGQGALAIETRADGGPASQICARLDHAPTRAAVTAERAVLNALGGGCQVPLGAHAVVSGDALHLRAVVVNHRAFVEEVSGLAADAEKMGAAAAQALISAGALPLAGKRVVVTRAAAQAGDLSGALAAHGAEVIELPVIEIRPLAWTLPAAHYDWIIFTSQNGVDQFAAGQPPQLGAKICSIGTATADAARRHGFEVDLLPDEFVAEAVVEAFASIELKDKRILLPRAAVARDVVPDQLRARGAVVDVLPVYETVAPAGLSEVARRIFASPPDWVTFSSGSSVKNLAAAAGTAALAAVRIASIGPVTSAAARKLGLAVAAEADPHTMDALVAAIVANTVS